MKSIFILLLAAGLISSSLRLCAQPKTYQVPAGVTLSTAEECRAHNDDFIKATDYLMAAPVDAPNRKEVNSFALMWMTNTSEVTVNVNADIILPLFDADLMLIHMIGWSRYVLKTHDTSEAHANLAGFRAALDYYKNPAHKATPNKKLDRLVKLDKEGKLEQEVAALMNGRK